MVDPKQDLRLKISYQTPNYYSLMNVPLIYIQVPTTPSARNSSEFQNWILERVASDDFVPFESEEQDQQSNTTYQVTTRANCAFGPGDIPAPFTAWVVVAGYGWQYSIDYMRGTCTPCSGVLCGKGAVCLDSGDKAGTCQCNNAEDYYEILGDCLRIPTIPISVARTIQARDDFNLFRFKVPANHRWSTAVQLIGSNDKTYTNLVMDDSPPLERSLLGPVTADPLSLRLRMDTCRPSEWYAFFGLTKLFGSLDAFTVSYETSSCDIAVNPCDEIFDGVCATRIPSTGAVNARIEAGRKEAFFAVLLRPGSQISIQVQAKTLNSVQVDSVSWANNVSMINEEFVTRPFKLSLHDCAVQMGSYRILKVSARAGAGFTIISVSSDSECPQAAMLTTARVTTPSKWLIMVYLCANNDLEYFSLEDVEEMAKVPPGPVLAGPCLCSALFCSALHARGC